MFWWLLVCLWIFSTFPFLFRQKLLYCTVQARTCFAINAISKNQISRFLYYFVWWPTLFFCWLDYAFISYMCVSYRLIRNKTICKPILLTVNLHVEKIPSIWELGNSCPYFIISNFTLTARKTLIRCLFSFITLAKQIWKVSLMSMMMMTMTNNICKQAYIFTAKNKTAINTNYECAPIFITVWHWHDSYFFQLI